MSERDYDLEYYAWLTTELWADLPRLVKEKLEIVPYNEIVAKKEALNGAGVYGEWWTRQAFKFSSSPTGSLSLCLMQELEKLPGVGWALSERVVKAIMTDIYAGHLPSRMVLYGNLGHHCSKHTVKLEPGKAWMHHIPQIKIAKRIQEWWLDNA